jgi:DMSO/TMAO reductase YedYZ molybdopterin-dependent catalytic subunit
VPFARSIPLEQALAGDVLIAWEMNGKPIPPKHGAPLRAIVPGNYGVASVKWLQRIEVLNRPFQGPFQVQDYQLNGEPLQQLRVSSLILTPEAHTTMPDGEVEISGIAWGGQSSIAAVEIRLAGGHWQTATTRPNTQPSALTRWSGVLEIPPGQHVVEARAHDHNGTTQPDLPQWNPLGYANNSIHRVPISAHDSHGLGRKG